MDKFVKHEFEPIYDRFSKVLILGTMPSPKSRETGFYYSHPQNRLWKILSCIFCVDLPTTTEEKIELLLSNKIAMWDVLKSCNITGASDLSIRNPIANDINIVLNSTDIKVIFTTGKKATNLYEKFCFSKTGIKSIYLPSTSPANCKLSFDRLLEEYSIIKNFIE